MTRIFISYRRDDFRFVAGILSHKLQEPFGRDSVFIDVDDIPIGVDFRERIVSAVEQWDLLLALVGERWFDAEPDGVQRRIDSPTDFVRMEIKAALNRGIPVVPVLVADAQMPSEDDLPSSVRPFAYRNAAEVRSGQELWRHIDKLIDGVDAHFREPPTSSERQEAVALQDNEEPPPDEKTVATMPGPSIRDVLQRPAWKGKILVDPGISATTLKNARNGCNVESNRIVIGLIDTIVYGSAKEAIVFTDQGVHFRRLSACRYPQVCLPISF